MNKADLHVHSSFSNDGELGVAELVQYGAFQFGKNFGNPSHSLIAAIRPDLKPALDGLHAAMTKDFTSYKQFLSGVWEKATGDDAYQRVDSAEKGEHFPYCFAEEDNGIEETSAFLGNG